ncbi:MAG: MFS transporter [Ignavibacteriae bacterium HGW-Ignavibacteriae-3]|nr:MAG: MFS transporter [Ignavibacteriae bacterium HGW-Ignavibacteriae-3]
MKIKNIPRAVVILGLVSFFTDFASEMLYPITPIFLTSVLGASMSVVGLIEGIAEVTAGLLKGYFGTLSDKLGKRSIFIVIGYSLSGFVKSLPGLIVTVPAVIISRVADRIGKGIRTAPRDALLASHANGNTGAVFGFHRSMDTFGAVAGPIAAIVLLYLFPGKYSWIYLFALIPSVFAIGFTFAVKDKKTAAGISNKKNYANFWKTAPAEYKRLLTFLTLFSLVNSSDVFLILKSKEIAHSDTIAILGYVFYNLIYALASYPIGILADKFGKKTTFTIGLIIFSLVYFGFALNTNFYLIWVLFAFYGIYAASTEGVSKAWVSDLVPDDFRGTAIGLLTMLSSFAVMAGSILAGFLWDSFGPQAPFLLSAFVSLFVAAGLFLFKR